MDFTDYQIKARKTAIYPSKYIVIYPALKLAGEAGEVAEKIGKSLRDQDGKFNEEELTKEIGDVLWYCAALASDLGLSLEDIAIENLAKLKSRQERGKLGGSGDDR